MKDIMVVYAANEKKGEWEIRFQIRNRKGSGKDHETWSGTEGVVHPQWWFKKIGWKSYWAVYKNKIDVKSLEYANNNRKKTYIEQKYWEYICGVHVLNYVW